MQVEFVGKNADGGVVSVKGGVPFSVRLEDAKKGDKAKAYPFLTALRLKTNTEIEISAEVYVEHKKYSSDFVSAVTEIEELEDKVQSQAAFKVYIVKNDEDLFGIAKNMNMRPEDIRVQNPTEAGEYEAGTRIVVYSPLTSNF